jgi:septum formation protein
VLGSSSPRRKDLLESCGLAFDIIPSTCTEEVLPGEAADDMTLRLAGEKAADVAARHPDAYVLGADTTVEVDGDILGKPRDAADAKRMLGRIQGRTHHVISAFAVAHHARGILHRACSQTLVEVAPLSAAAINAYVATGESMDKAGSYAMQGRGGFFVTRIEGSYSNVIGMDLAAVVDALLVLKLAAYR